MNDVNEDLPPLSSLQAIFGDLVGASVDGLKKVAKKLNGRKLRVATMCSCVARISCAIEMLTDQAHSSSFAEERNRLYSR